MPSSVRVMVRPLRLKRGVPRSSSRAASWRERVGWVMWSWEAALVKL